jgi:hypothetical protein
MNVANSVLLRMGIIMKANIVNLFVSSVLFVFCYHSPNFLDTQRISTYQYHNIRYPEFMCNENLFGMIKLSLNITDSL